MKSLIVLFCILVIVACAPLQRHDSAWGTAGEIALRTALCPLTLCLSELGKAMDYERAQRDAAYGQWYQGLSPEEQDRADRREAARLQALGLALSGGGPLQRPNASRVLPMPIAPRVSCTEVQTGAFSQVNCY